MPLTALTCAIENHSTNTHAVAISANSVVDIQRTPHVYAAIYYVSTYVVILTV